MAGDKVFSYNLPNSNGIRHNIHFTLYTPRMTPKQAKLKIEKIFGTVSAFARITGSDRYELQKMLKRQELTETDRAALRLLFELHKRSIDPSRITKEKLSLIRKRLNEFGGVYLFCKENPEFQMGQVYAVYNGQVKTLQSKVAKKLFEFFKIE